MRTRCSLRSAVGLIQTAAITITAVLALSAQTIRVVPTYHNVGVDVQLAEVPPADTVIAMSLKESVGGADFRPIHSLSRIATHRFAGSAFFLKADTDYTLQLTSVLWATNRTLFVRTRAETVLKPKGTVYHIALDGDDENDGRSRASAFRTLAHALEIVRAGEKILLHEGRFHEGDIEVYPRSSGEAEAFPDAPIVIESAPGEHPILDGSDLAFAPQWEMYDAVHGVYRAASDRIPYHAYLEGGHCYHFGQLDDLRTNRWNQMSGYFADGTHIYLRLPDGGPPGTRRFTIPRYTFALVLSVNHYQVRGLEFCYYGYDREPAAIHLDSGSSNLVEQCQFHHTGMGVVIRHDSIHNTIQECSFSEWPVDTFSWEAVKQGIPFGSEPYESGGVVVYGEHQSYDGNVIRSNLFQHMFDGAHLFSDEESAPTENLDFHDNLVLDCGDDGIETDGVGSNCRIYRNTFSNILTGISVAPAALGPTYIFRNQILQWHSVPSSEGDGDGYFHGYPIKLNHQMREWPWTSWVFLYHNTCTTTVPEQDGFVFNYYWWYWTNIVSRNNTYTGTRRALWNANDLCPIDFDHDNVYAPDASPLIQWFDSAYPTLADFVQATGQEAHGLSADPGFLAPLDVRLRADSPLVDRGCPIPGINDDFMGAGPDIGAWEFKPEATLSPTVIAVQVEGAFLLTRWRVTPGSLCQLEFAEHLTSPGWKTTGSAVVATNASIEFRELRLLPTGFFRLVTRNP